MRHFIFLLAQATAVAFALLRGIGELAMLQRWRLHGWLRLHR